MIPKQDIAKMELFNVLKPISREIKLVTDELDTQVQKICDGQSQDTPYREEICQTIKHLFNIPGKLLRPALVLLSGKAVAPSDGPLDNSLIEMAVAVEFLHSASLVHDDILDKSEIRRNQQSLNFRYGNHLGVLVGDILYSQFFSITTGLQSVPPNQRLRLLDEFSDVTKKMCLGEMYEHYIKTNAIEPSFEDYLSVIESKTASLLSMCCFTGALLNGADEKLIRKMTGFGLNLGMAFQIVDDYLDNDSVFNEKSVLLEKATEYMSLAEEQVVSLQQNSISDCLQIMHNL